MIKRTDIHRPSSVDFDPEAYSFIGILDLNPFGFYDKDTYEYQVDDQSTPDILANIVLALDNGYNFAPHIVSKANLTVGWQNNIAVGNDNIELYEMNYCGHCGSMIRFAGVLTHKNSKEIIYVGEECLTNRFQELTKAEFHRLREQSKLNRDRIKKQKKIEQILKEHPMLGADISELKNFFLADIQGKLNNTGELSDRQISAFEKALPKEKDRKAQMDKEMEELKSVPDAPTGRFEITGQVLKIKYIENDYYNSITSKMVLHTTDGWKLWVTLPESIWDATEGDTVSMSVDITPSKEDRKFAYGKRPTKAIIK
jgi:hypothetical protein